MYKHTHTSCCLDDGKHMLPVVVYHQQGQRKVCLPLVMSPTCTLPGFLSDPAIQIDRCLTVYTGGKHVRGSNFLPSF